MIRKNSLFSWLTTVSLFLLFSLGIAHFAFAQGSQASGVLSFNLPKPTVFKPKEVTGTSFSASWRNVPPVEGEFKTTNYRLHLTHEFEAKEDTLYPVGNAVVKGAEQETGLLAAGGQVWLDNYLTQGAWWGSYIKALPGAIRIDAGAIPSNIPDDLIENFARIVSPVYDLQNNGGEFTFKFKAKVASGTTAAKLSVYGYGEETPPKKISDVKELVVPADGQEHEFSLSFKTGTWCHVLVVLVKNRVSVDFVDAFKIEQNLKKGDKGFRSVMRGAFTKDNLVKEDVVDAANPFATIYSREIGDLTPDILDVEQAKSRGERVAYRVLCESVLVTALKTFVSRSLYSEPAYFDNIPSDENKYLYVGYCDYEEPDYNKAIPGSVPEDQKGYASAAIKATKELLSEYVGGKVVGLRFCVAAAAQVNTGHKFTPVPWEQSVPHIYLAERLRTWQDSWDGNYSDESKTKFIKTKSAVFHDGWNSVFFDEPYPIEKDKEFFAGAFLYDEAASGLTFVGGRRIDETTKSPDAFMEAYNASGLPVDLIPFGRYAALDNAVLMQLIVEPDPNNPKFQNRATFSDLKSEVLYYDHEPVTLLATVKNDGVKAIQTLNLKVEMAGETKEHVVNFKEPVASASSIEFEFQPFEKLSKFGETDVKVTFTKINETTLEVPAILETKTKLIDHSKVFPRTIMFELFTSENCPNCPQGESFFLFRFGKPEFKYIKDRTVFVSHHTGSVGGDFLKHSYSSQLFPFYGVVSNAGNLKFRSAFTPGGMFNRTINPHFSTRDPYAPVSSLYMLEDVFRKSINHATYREPAYGRLALKDTYDDATKKLKVDIEGEISELIDPTRPVYVSIMLVQNSVKARAQKDGGKINPNYVHHNVLRYVDEAGLQGMPVQLDANRKFTISKTIDLVGVEAGGSLQDNQLLLEDEAGTPITMKELVEEGLQVIAFLHYSVQLPTLDDVEKNDPRIGKNEIINVASNRIKEPKAYYPAEEILSIDTPIFDATQEIVYVANRAVHVTSAYNNLKVFAIDGTIVRNQDLADGAYVVRVELIDGRLITAKVIVR